MTQSESDGPTPVARGETIAAALKLLQDTAVTRAPTPVEDLLTRCGLASEKFSLIDPYVERGLPVPLAQARADMRLMVRGMVDVTDHIVYTHRQLGREQSRFVTLHELGHYYLEWHNALLQTCSESDLSPVARRTWEREANLFAATCLFQGDKFALDAARSFFGWQSLRTLAKNYGASLESAAWEYVKARKQPALYMVATLAESVTLTAQAATGEPLLEVKYAVASPGWWDRFGRGGVPAAGLSLPWAHPATRLLLSGSRAALPTQTTIDLPTGASVPVKAELLSNGRDVLMLAQPQ